MEEDEQACLACVLWRTRNQGKSELQMKKEVTCDGEMATKTGTIKRSKKRLRINRATSQFILYEAEERLVRANSIQT